MATNAGGARISAVGRSLAEKSLFKIRVGYSKAFNRFRLSNTRQRPICHSEFAAGLARS